MLCCVKEKRTSHQRFVITVTRFVYSKSCRVRSFLYASASNCNSWFHPISSHDDATADWSQSRLHGQSHGHTDTSRSSPRMDARNDGRSKLVSFITFFLIHLNFSDILHSFFYDFVFNLPMFKVKVRLSHMWLGVFFLFEGRRNCGISSNFCQSLGRRKKKREMWIKRCGRGLFLRQ